jgi:predicted ATPase/transcriptional regulator with XRE-family HTH domain
MSERRSVPLSELVRRYRSLEGLSQEQLAERSGLSTRQISDLERGLRTMPRLETIRMLAEGLALGDEDRSQLLLAARPGIQAISERMAAEARAADAHSPSDEDLRIAPPIPPTAMIGRDDEIDRLLSLLLDSDCRLITVTGPGGVGKTRLALEVARRAAPNFTWGAVFVDLVPASGPDAVASTIAQAVGAEESDHVSISDSLRATLAPRETLLVIDNFEHVLEAAPLLSDLLAASPGMRILTTSRAALRLRGETQFDLQPLATPADQETADLELLATNPSVALFVEVARRTAPDFSLAPENAAVVTHICQRLEGLPLAIELAAARVKLLGPALLLERMDQRLSLLIDGPRDLPTRQRTLANTIAWSFDLLTSDEQALFRRMAVFVGGGQLDSIEAINSAIGSTGAATWLGLSSLVEKSLVRRVDDWGGPPRFSMLETIREFALNELACSGEEDVVRWAHAGHFLEFAEGQPRDYMARVFTFGSRDRMVAEFDNIRAALKWFDAQQDVTNFTRMVIATVDLFYDRGLYTEAIALCQRAKELTEVHPLEDRLQVRLACVLAQMANSMGDSALAELTARKCVDRLQKDLSNHDLLPIALIELLTAIREQGRFPEALAIAKEALNLSRELGDQYLEAHSLYHVGKIHFLQGEPGQAINFWEESLVLGRRIGAMATVIFVVVYLAAERIVRGEVKEAAALLRGVSQLWQSGGNKIEAGAFWLGYVGALAAQARLPEQAAVLYGFGYTFTGYCGVKGSIKSVFEGIIADLRSQFDESEFRALFDQGVDMTLDEAIALADEVFNSIEHRAIA